jgi:hypothetical protein
MGFGLQTPMLAAGGQATVTVIAPIPLIDICSRSPGAIGPTPGGAPVKSTSPGRRVITEEA